MTESVITVITFAGGVGAGFAFSGLLWSGMVDRYRQRLRTMTEDRDWWKTKARKRRAGSRLRGARRLG